LGRKAFKDDSSFLFMKWWVVSLVVLVVLVGLLFGYFLFFSPGYGAAYDALLASGELQNPVASLSVEEAVAQFDERYVYYLLVLIKAYNLHNPPLSGDTPKFNVVVEDVSYRVVVDGGVIAVEKGNFEESDVVIYSTRLELVRMLKDESYTKQSFGEGLSRIELVADSTTLASKGYLGMYNAVSDGSVTGNVVRLYTG